MSKIFLLAVAKILIMSISAVGAIILVSRFFGPLPISVSQTVAQKQSTFDVFGTSEVSVVPDNAKISVGLEVRNPSSTRAKDEVNEKVNAIRAQLESIGIKKEDIKTENFSIYPEYNYELSPQRIVGYIVSTNLTVTIKDFENINAVIDTSTAAGANQVGGVQFTLSEEKEKEVKKQAREEAINEAKDNANELSGLAGMRLGKIVNVIESPQPSTPEFFRETKALSIAPDAAMGGGVPTQIEPGSTTYSYTITLSYETL